MKAFCEFCGGFEDVRVGMAPVTMQIRGIRFTYDEGRAFCIRCGCPVYVAEVSDMNAEKRKTAFEKKKSYRKALAGDLRTVAMRADGNAAALMRDAAKELEVTDED